MRKLSLVAVTLALLAAPSAIASSSSAPSAASCDGACCDLTCGSVCDVCDLPCPTDAEAAK